MKRFRIVLALSLCCMSLFSFAKTWKNPNIQKPENLLEYEMKPSGHLYSHRAIKMQLPPRRVEELRTISKATEQDYPGSAAFQLIKDSELYAVIFYKEVSSAQKKVLEKNYSSNITHEKILNIREVVLMTFSLKGQAFDLMNRNTCRKNELLSFYQYETTNTNFASIPIKIHGNENTEFKLSVTISQNREQHSKEYAQISLSAQNRMITSISVNHKPYLLSLEDSNLNGYYDDNDEYTIGTGNIAGVLDGGNLDQSFHLEGDEYVIAKIKTFFSKTTLYLGKQSKQKNIDQYPADLRYLPISGALLPAQKNDHLTILVDFPFEDCAQGTPKEYWMIFEQMHKAIARTGKDVLYQVLVANRPNPYIYDDLQLYLPENAPCDILLKFGQYGGNNNYQKVFPRSKRYEDANLFDPKKIRIKVFNEKLQPIQCKEIIGPDDMDALLRSIKKPIIEKALKIEPETFNNLSKKPIKFPYLKEGAITVLLDAHVSYAPSINGLLGKHAHIKKALEKIYPDQEFIWELVGNSDLAHHLNASRHLFADTTNIHAVILPFGSRSAAYYRTNFPHLHGTSPQQKAHISFINDQGEIIYTSRNFRIENRIELDRYFGKVSKKTEQNITLTEAQEITEWPVPEYITTTSVMVNEQSFTMSHKDGRYQNRALPFDRNAVILNRIFAHPDKPVFYYNSLNTMQDMKNSTLYEFCPKTMKVLNQWTADFHICDYDPSTGYLLGHKRMNKRNSGALYLKDTMGKHRTIKIKVPMTGTLYPILIRGEESLITVGKKDGQLDLWRVNKIYSKKPEWVRLTETPEKEEFSAVSFDGKKLIFQRADKDGYNLYLYDFEAKSIRKVTENPDLDCMASFCPDNESIIYIRRTEKHHPMRPVVMNLQTGEIQEISCNQSFRNYSYPIALKKLEE